MTLAERAAHYLSVFTGCEDAVWVAGKGRWLYGHWAIGNDYRNKTRYYGAYPNSYLERVAALYPDVPEAGILHAFSGSLQAGAYTRLDVNPTLGAELVGSVYEVDALTDQTFDLVMVDPPYSKADAVNYGTPMINRGKVTAALARVVKPGGHMVFLDTTWPMHRKELWHYYGSIHLVRCTNHRTRTVSLFERTAQAA